MSIVSAIVVTYNSSAVVLKLLHQLMVQSHPLDNIIVVDNHSQDDTCELINNFANSTVHLYRLPKNLGGAGGFALGFEKAIALGSDKIFTFDDDAIPQGTDFIAQMLAFEHTHSLAVVAPIVADCSNPSQAAFEYKHEKQKLSNIAKLQSLKIIRDDIKLFNGVLFDKRVIQNLKGPRPEFFIRGDEQEFKTRILQAKYPVAICTGCLVYHPSSLDEYIEVAGRRYHHINSAFKLFYSTRNRIYMLKLRQDFSLRKKTVMISKEFYYYTWFYLIYRKGDWLNYWIWLRAFMFGLTGYMNNEVIINN